MILVYEIYRKNWLEDSKPTGPGILDEYIRKIPEMFAKYQH